LISTIDQTRLLISKNTESKKKSQFGQFLTSEKTAAFMANMFPPANGNCQLLDAGAGIGSLAAAFLDRVASPAENRSPEVQAKLSQPEGFDFQQIKIDAFEIDDSLHPYLSATLAKYSDNPHIIPIIHSTDFIHAATDWLSGNLFAAPLPMYTHAILNPPYKKINSNSAHRLALRRTGIETVNLYSAFVALAVALTAPSGQIVAIIPRSFCNGPYYRPFRDFILERTAIHHIHLFQSRSKAFKDDNVLQENIIIRLERGGKQGLVTISTSIDDTFTDITTHEHPFEQIVSPTDSERFIHVPTSAPSNQEISSTIHYSLADLDIKVSTGPVVDFRLKEHLCDMPEAGTVPLLYPVHFSSSDTIWPVIGTKKPNAIQHNIETEKWLYPIGFYCVVRRFSSKEEKRRIVASTVDPATFHDAPVLGFENHLNLFHENKHGLPEALAHGLTMFLNSTNVDEYFRRFSGHTQVNATDLKTMKYPSRETLFELGIWVMQQQELTQEMIDEKLGDIIG
jgi:adenine-specific DNA-methyltransferase